MESIQNYLQSLGKSILRRFGYDVYRLRPTMAAGMAYEGIQTIANYAPWNLDKAFIRAYEMTQSHTMVDRYRLYELWCMVEQVSKLAGAMVEVGVWRGGSGGIMALRANQLEIQDTLYLCDTFEGVVKASEKDSLYRGGEHADTTKAIVESLLTTLGVKNVKVLQGIFPDETAGQIAETRLRLAHIDVDTYNSARDIVAWAWEKLVPGGVIIYDDYGFKGCDGITRYVDEQRTLMDRLVIHNLNGHAIVIKLS